MNRAILVHPTPMLYSLARPVPDEMFGSDELRQVIEDLRDTMDELARAGRPAHGLAAPQIGEPRRVFVMGQWPHAFVNPRITYVLGRPVFDTEECFSLPAIRVTVGRARMVKVKYRLWPDGVERGAKMRDLDARVFQHEYDHLDGVTIAQRSESDGDISILYDLGHDAAA